MTIDYNIIWFEDIKSSFDAKKNIVKNIVLGLGLNFPEPRWEINGDNIESIDFQDFDLIIVDLNLGKEKGSSLIDQIRNMDIYTEVIFYSSNGEKAVRDELKLFDIDGVYCAGRDNDEFETKVEKVIRTTIKKVQDLNNMRGLIMAETSDIDNVMADIIRTVIEKNSYGFKDDIIAFIYENVEKKVSSKKKDFEKYKLNGRIDKVTKDTLMFDSYQKILCIQHIIDLIDHEIMVPHKNKMFEEGYTEIKRKRDLLAHVIEVYEEGEKETKKW